MKKTVTLIFFLTSFFCGIHAQITTLDSELAAALPSGQFFLPAPPAENSLIWRDDTTTYFQYRRAARHFDEEKQEYWDSVWAIINEQYYFALYRLAADSVMNAPFITGVSWTKGTQKYTVSYTRNTTDFQKINELQQLCEKMKTVNTGKWRTRPRPYYYYGDWYKGSKVLKPNDKTSYPSGHGYFAGLFGMCMMYIDPANALKIKTMMDEWMERRLILGAHWKTDLSAGWQLGTIAFSIAMNYDQFHDLVMAAKAELATYRAEQETPTTVDQTQNEAPKATKVIESGTVRIVKGDYQYNTLGNIIR